MLEAARPLRRLVDDKAYDTDSLRQCFAKAKFKAVIPSRQRENPPHNPLGRKAYRRRNVIERLFSRLKNWRRIATRYDRLAQNFLSAIAPLSAVIAWI